MCGIVGFWDGQRADGAVAERMASQITHRGPDDSGVWVDDAAGLALAHRRLSILDLSSAGHQPMVSPCGRYTLVYNGEIYNHLELRAELENEGGHFDWRGHSDTETLLAAMRHWGVERGLQRLNGMFALAFWDREKRILYLARDRMGEKPLYYGRNGCTFLFGSELKALTAHPAWRGEVDRNALALYLRHNCVPSPWSIYRGIRKLPPAHFVVVQEGGGEVSNPHCYWDLARIAEQSVGMADGDEPEMADALDRLLRDAVRRRLAADVSLGAFLSGGLDSTTVVALMQEQSSRPVKTFTIGFHEAAYNEANQAKAVAAHLGTDHRELYVTPEEAMAVIPQLPGIWDEPFSDSSQIPTFLVCKLARTEVTVALSGDGGDEVFGGYNRHVWGPIIWGRIKSLPLPLRHAIGKILGRLSPGQWSCLFSAVNPLLPKMARHRNPGDKIQKLAGILSAASRSDLYTRLCSHWSKPESIINNAEEYSTRLTSVEKWSDLENFSQWMMYMDSVTYLPDDILVKVDRASMGVSLEARVPLIDHRVVEFAWTLPLSMKIRDGEGKWLMRKVLQKYVPQELVDRPKAGFGIPLDVWLRGPLRDWAESLLAENRLRAEGFFNPVPIRRRWEEHLSGKYNWQYLIWDLLMFQAWFDETQKR